MDIDEASESMPNELQDIDSVPTFHVYKNGKLIDTLMGADPSKLKKAIDKINEGREEASEAGKDEKKEDKKEEKKEEDKEADEKKPGSRKGSKEDHQVGKVHTVEKGSEFEKLTSSGNDIVE